MSIKLSERVSAVERALLMNSIGTSLAIIALIVHIILTR